MPRQSLQAGTQRVRSSGRAALKSAGLRAWRGLGLTTRRRILYFYTPPRWLHLDPPRTFNEKVNWRIINDRREIIGFTCDKLKAKEYAASRGVSPPRTIWHGTDLSELTAVDLPEYWVLKPNHRTGIVHFGRGRPNISTLQRLTRSWLDETNWAELGEWAYSQAERCYFVEERLGRPGEDLPDYKFFVFDGRVELIQLDTERHTAHHRRLYTRDWMALDVQLLHPLAPILPRPDNLDDMLVAAEKLGAEFDMIRIDLYHFNDTLWFGELTPYPGTGRSPFRPYYLDQELGAKWELPALEW